jgi:hypothetical protein
MCRQYMVLESILCHSKTLKKLTAPPLSTLRETEQPRLWFSCCVYDDPYGWAGYPSYTYFTMPFQKKP